MRSYFPPTILFYLLLVIHFGFISLGYYIDNSGNELQSSEVLFSYSSKFNSTDYFSDSNNCRGQPKYYMCIKLVNQFHRNVFRLWHPADHSLRRKLDCNYQLSFHTGERLNEYFVFKFIIYQSNCLNSIPGLIGGTTFSTFASSDSFLISCSSIDLFNYTYEVICKFPLLNDKILRYNTQNNKNIAYMKGKVNNSEIVNEDSICMKLTALVEYEHFDAFSESIVDWSEKYPPSHSLIANHVRFCVPYGRTIASSEGSSSEDSAISKVGYRLQHSNTRSETISADRKEKFIIISGFWVDGNLMMEDITGNSGKSNAPSNISISDLSLLIREKHKFYSAFRSYLIEGPTKPNISEIKDMELPLLSLIFEEESVYNQIYSFFPTVAKVFNSIKRPLKPSFAGLITAYNYSDYSSGVIASKHDFHFIGMSHIRYLYDSILEYFIGNDVLVDKVRRHDHMQYRNFIFNGTGIAFDQVALISDICKSRESLENRGFGDKLKYLTIVMHSGAWDLSLASLRKLMKDPQTYPSLIRVLLGLLSGSIKCPKLRQVVWLTTVPYPMCHDPRESKCNNDRSFRVNSAIAAVNQFVLNQLLAAEVEVPNVLLSVIDANTIITPRLILNEDHEKVCTNHYLCRKTAGHQTSHTPGGNALLQSLLFALNRSLLD